MSGENVEYDSVADRLNSVIVSSFTGQCVEQKGTSKYEFRQDEFWRKLERWHSVDADTFLNHLWQEKNAVTSVAVLGDLIKDITPAGFVSDIEKGHQLAPMSIRLTPYILSLIDWSNPYFDPLRRQFLPLASEIEVDHPMVQLDPMGEQNDSPAMGLTHRYPDRVLFLATNVCPVYCRYCTRSYAVGLDTDVVTKQKINAPGERWEPAFRYIAANSSVEDVVVSGGDAYRLKARQITDIGERLLEIPHVRRMRFATKGLAVLPMKIQSDHEWTDAIARLSDRARKMGKSIAIHTHFNHPNEITDMTVKALRILYERGVEVRNQAVILKGVNNNATDMHRLNECLAYCNVRPYYCFQGDMIRGVETLRTSLADSIALEKSTRGLIAGHNTPHFIVDLPGGGGKRDIHSFDYYDKHVGVAVYRAPAVKKDKFFLYCDPLHTLASDVQALWLSPASRTQLLNDVVHAAY
ncbi:KamA family radical SAM protein [Pseudomonas sp. WS 5532]|jgi:lysine 2,3-aminomutase|uniref:KamA family radical SAM protein n=1 Tax=Pseudomonas edaphica TaxID=2006980 RepID=A0A7Y8KEJ2_9PSED|nr:MULTISPECIES: KamA family radical SAM protein [Pseudomonas]MCF5142404.1 KamA family radical SAM protein [Pseudomonas sp. PA-6-3C]MCF5149707.1 KamA family radical SAM protein [Pseudomonas sp. PA-6-3F]MCF5159944.1 KamA family radical SAM protein [Pseudomonas sp. PA-6-2E]MCF5174863.1 KamA family radical SAM protein [Pseudomonas sp. PA-6-1D]MCF5192162.1 KamA family radical SAM protein [Pseudomonas sp. PA-6-1H]